MSQRASHPFPSPRPRSRAAGWLAGLLAAALGAGAVEGCARGEPPGAEPGRVAEVPAASVQIGAAPVAASGSAAGATRPAKKAPEGPAAPTTTLAVVGGMAQVFLGPAATKGGQIGYIRRGSKIKSSGEPVKGPGCNEGWYKLEPVGYVCAKHTTADLESPQAKGIKEPALEEILPYKYASNVAHGTPLYRTIPTQEEMAEYEPYLKLPRHHQERTASADTAKSEPTKKRSKKRRRNKKAQADQADSQPEGKDRPEADEKDPTDTSPSPAGSAATAAPAAASAPAAATATTAAPAAASAAGNSGSQASTVSTAEIEGAPDAGAPDAGDEDSTKPWWMRKYEPGKTPEITLADMNAGADKTLARRMAKGFYVAIDHTFFNNNRGWHKTTAGLIAPSDRLAIVKPNPFHGQEIDEAHAANALAFILIKQATKVTLEGDKKTPKPAGTMDRYERAFLTGKTETVGQKLYRETTDGYWLRDSDIAYTQPGPPPAGIGPGEKWVDVNLARQTIVAFEGTHPVFATLVSTGRKGKDKAHDHQTPHGTWRVREKHIAATMDGDGAAAGDMPYSIEDVPYVMYFHESYALHGAFWHDNFGRQQSHGCVNLAPLDAKRIFFWSDPQIPAGWHGMNSSPDMPGTTVVVHD
jgi:lipoprotein-anchoring transpeptidase ErfK/SrfK